MNAIENLPKVIVIEKKFFEPRIYITAWEKWCISYQNLAERKKAFSVVVEDREPLNIEDTENSLNTNIGNARTLDDAVEMILNYINKKGYLKK